MRLLLLFVALPSLSFATDWTLESVEDGIQFYTAHHPSGYNATRVEMEIDASLHSLVAMNTDAANFKNWMHTVLEVITITPGTDTYTLKLLWDIPWPYQDRESVSQSIWKQDSESKVVRLEFKSIDEVTISNEYQRMIVSGSWTYTPIDNGKVNVVYESHADPGGNLPPILVNPFSADIPVQTFKNLRKEVKKYETAKVSWIDNNR